MPARQVKGMLGEGVPGKLQAHRELPGTKCINGMSMGIDECLKIPPATDKRCLYKGEGIHEGGGVSRQNERVGNE